MDLKQINEKLELVIHKLMNLDAPDPETMNELPDEEKKKGAAKRQVFRLPFSQLVIIWLPFSSVNDGTTVARKSFGLKKHKISRLS